MNRGSTWHKWDFHLHTPHSVLNNKFGDPQIDSTWDRYVDEIESKAKQTGIAAIGITDYFFIEGYKRVRSYQQQGRLGDLFLFPNVEFRINRFIKGKRLNAHVIFSPQLSPDLIEEHFLHDLDFVYEDEPFESSQKRRLKISNLEEFGCLLKKQHESFADRSSLEVGCMCAVVSLDNVKERLQDNRFLGKHLIVLCDDLSTISWDGQDHATRKHLHQMSHAIFSSNPNAREFCLGRKHSSEEEYIAEFKSFKPCIWGCDSHGYNERFLEPDLQRYCWIKGELSWEGLKQILYEPRDRVRIQTKSPEPQKTMFTLDSIQIGETRLNDDLSIKGLDIHLNPNLVTIIGGRGSGKTAFLDAIAVCFREGNKLGKLENSFYRRLYGGDRKPLNNARPLPVAIRFQSGEEFHKSVGEEHQVYEQTDVTYLTQNHMEDYTVYPNKLRDHIVDLVFARLPGRRQQYDAFEDDAGRLQDQIEALNLEIEQLGEDVERGLEPARVELAEKQGELADLQNRLTTLIVEHGESATKAEELTKRMRTLESTRDSIIVLSQETSSFHESIEAFRDHYQREAKAINEKITSLEGVSNVGLLLEELDQFMTVLQILNRNRDNLDRQLSETQADIKVAEAKLTKLQGIEQTIANLRRSIDSTSDEIKAIQNRIDGLKDKRKRIKELDRKRVNKYALMMQKRAEQRLFMQELIDEFEEDKDELLSGISFQAIVDTSGRDGYVNKLVEKLDGRVHSYESVNSDLTVIIGDADEIMNSSNASGTLFDLEALSPFGLKLREWATKVRLKRSTEEADFFNALFSPFFDIGMQIGFNDRPLEALSMGERAVVLLKILLGLDDRPLLIDQPEEHLDNRYIYDELTPAFRSAKRKRQIIVATHNANLVVNTDAEQILLAEHSDGTLSYQVGTLEDLDVREAIKTILEGGDQAFKKREEKYGYRF